MDGYLFGYIKKKSFYKLRRLFVQLHLKFVLVSTNLDGYLYGYIKK